MWHMRHASVRDLHIRTSELVREAADGAIIVIERRGQPVAELRPLAPENQLTEADKDRIWARMEKLWTKMPSFADDSTRIVSEDRDR